MARTNKTGIDYFPFDVDFYQDEKVQFVSARFGLKGEAIVTRLLCKIYRNGYYTEWNDDTALLFAKGVGDGCRDSCVKDVVHELLKRGFFDKGIFERFSVLTGRGIQKRYFEATKRYKKVEAIHEFLLVDVSKMINVSINKINVYINSENVDINPQREIEKEIEKEIEREKTSRDGIFENINEISKRLKNTMWLEQVGMKLSVSPNDLLKYYADFVDRLNLNGDVSKTERDFRAHFLNWLSQKKEKEKNLKQIQKPENNDRQYKNLCQ